MKRQMQFTVVSFCLGVSLLVSAGCTQRAYDGPAHPSSELSRLQRQPGSASGAVKTESYWFVSVDEWQIDRHRDVDVLPGLHEIIFEVSWRGGFVEQIPIRLETTAGQTYQFHAQTHDPDYGIGEAILEGAAEGAAPLLLPFLPLIWAIQDSNRATHRPLDLDCAVWVTELGSDTVVWGAEPAWAWTKGW